MNKMKARTKRPCLRVFLLPPRTPLDGARFTAGMVRFYDAIFNESAPEKMLRLIDEIAKQERKYLP